MAKSTYPESRLANETDCAGAGFRRLSVALDDELARVQQRVGEIRPSRLTPADLGALADRCPQFGRLAELLDVAVRR